MSVSDNDCPLTDAWTPLRYHPVQAQLWSSRARFAAVPAGRGSGKTELAKRRLVRMLPVRKEWSDPRYFYGAPTEKQAKRIAWHSLLRLVPPEWLHEAHRGDLLIQSIFGSVIQLVGLDRPQRIEGVQWDGGVIDESCDIKPGTFDLSILPALVWRHGWCWRIGVPKRYGVGATEYRLFYERAARGEMKDAVGLTWPSGDIIPQEALETARANMDPRDFAEQFDAQFIGASGGIFHAFDEDFNVRPCLYRSEKPIIVGSDFNVNPMAWVLCHTYEEGRGRLEVFDMLWLRDTNTRDTLSVLKQRYGNHEGGFEFYGDATSRARKTSAFSSDYMQILSDIDFKRMGRTLHYIHSNPPQADRFAATNALIKTADGCRRCFIDASCKPLIEDLRLRTFRPGTREPMDTQDIGHATDALGYIIFKRFPIRIMIPGQYEVAVTGV